MLRGVTKGREGTVRIRPERQRIRPFRKVHWTSLRSKKSSFLGDKEPPTVSLSSIIVQKFHSNQPYYKVKDGSSSSL